MMGYWVKVAGRPLTSLLSFPVRVSRRELCSSAVVEQFRLG